MHDHRTDRSVSDLGEDFERSGGQARPFFASDDEDLAIAIEHAIVAGACRRAAVRDLAKRTTWNAVAEARRRKSTDALGRWLAARRDNV